MINNLDYKILFEDLPEGAFTINTDWKITSFNETAVNITGFSKKEAIGRYCWEIFRSEICQKGCPLSITMDTGKKQFEQEVLVKDRFGKQQALCVNVNILRDNNGDILGAVETFQKHGSFFDHSDQMFQGIIGKSKPMKSLFSMMPDVAESGTNVIICGESGTGKELIARAIHNLSKCKKGPFVAVNCAALSESLLESELFGHEKGAFTGADRLKIGRFELAKGGTLFLDEIGELKPNLQVKLLRVIEQRIFERVGGTKTISLDARIVSATNQNLEKAMKESRFREDLFYRLRTVPFFLPPLRERLEDIPLLVDHFIKLFNDKYNKNVRSVDPKVINLFMKYKWPGNVRELEKCIEYAFVFVKGPVIFSRYLPEFQSCENILSDNNLIISNPNIKDKDSVLSALSKTSWNRQDAAEMLGISRTSLWRRMKTLGLI
ncbi:MAG: sigma 54-interacting transcriptional regulator [Desulfobacterales bacterium]|nr:sigma 54-interacting transcriptional regulator [Desulfobacterales bacterium]MBF0397523.1 sigma 54-interacting transcriptional regulator [Desulfobacterales bacterium]